MVRIESRVGAVELVRNTVEIVRKETRVDVEGHGRRGVPEHLLYRLGVGACGHSELAAV